MKKLFSLLIIISILSMPFSLGVAAEVDNADVLNGVDISYWNMTVDWEMAKSRGVDFAIIRCFSYTKDSMFEKNYDGAKAAGLDVGTYIYMYADNVDEAVEEATKAVNYLNNRTLEYPVFLDIEDTVDPDYTAKTKAENTDILLAEAQVFEEAGYEVGIYTFESFWFNNVDTKRLAGYDLWLANWPHINKDPVYFDDFDPASYDVECNLWQFSDRGDGEYYGTSSEYVDMNFCYLDYSNVKEPPSKATCIAKLREQYPNISTPQIVACIEHVAAQNPDYTADDVLNYASGLKSIYPTVSGDFDNDGKSDSAQFYNTRYNEINLDVLHSDGESFERVSAWSSGSGWYIDSIKDSIVTGDFNGDSKDDICAFYDYGKGHLRTFVWLATDSGFKLNWKFWEMQSGFYLDDILSRIVAGDFNGDGLDDLCAFYDYGGGWTRAFVWQSTGSKFSLKWNWWNMTSGYTASNINDRVVAGDFNGDGRDDICGFYDYGNNRTRAFVWISNQNDSFSMQWNWWYVTSGFTADKITHRVVAGDFDGDGKDDDICGFFDYGKGEIRAFVWLSNGSTTFSMQWNWWYMSSGFYVDNFADRFVSGDFNGDSKVDIGGYYCYNDNTNRMFVYSSTGNRFNLNWNWWLG